MLHKTCLKPTGSKISAAIFTTGLIAVLQSWQQIRTTTNLGLQVSGREVIVLGRQQWGRVCGKGRRGGDRKCATAAGGADGEDNKIDFVC